MIVTHQFLDSGYFFPTWEVNKLFLGTFNPSCGQQVDYYYRRESNGFWKILKRYNNGNEIGDFTQLREFMRINHFGCVDVIRSVEFPDTKESDICGNGYSDDKLFTVTDFTRIYNFEQIKNYIIEHQITNVFSTWGGREKPKEFKVLLNEFRQFCTQRGVDYTPLSSPSGWMYYDDNIEKINTEWWSSLDPLFNKP